MDRLKKLLSNIDQKGYKSYKEIQGMYQFSHFFLHIDYVQGDPFASPSKIRLRIPLNKTEMNEDWCMLSHHRIRCEDTIARKVGQAVKKQNRNIRGSGKSGLILFDEPRQKVVERSAVMIDHKFVTICLSVGLPANGRRIAGKDAVRLLCSYIPIIIENSLLKLTEAELYNEIKLADQQQTIRRYLKEHQLIAFIANKAILARESGVSDQPMKTDVVPFASPGCLEIAINIPHQVEPIKGMAIKKGITLIVGGGYHGKSTLLKAIESGVYDHCEGDGREFVITNKQAVKIRAEDGRSVRSVNISPFIRSLPFSNNTTCFSTDNASGSTSQAANAMEMIEIGAEALLIDEDTTATNFMIRDARMQQLIEKESEPITPFIDKIEQLKKEKDISSIIVMGGSGDYFDVADCVIKMKEYRPFEVTGEAKAIAQQIKVDRQHEGGHSFGYVSDRYLLPNSLKSMEGRKRKVKARGMYEIQYGSQSINLHYIEQLVEESQTRMIADILYYVEQNNHLTKQYSLKELADFLETQLNKQGITFVSQHNGHPGDIARPRVFEIVAALNRLRSVQIK
ncbi:ABC-ATPase domain-containing protein [Halalkalibacter sp. APA_J-10(15)]|uniref:ABC-ATPase domain-containing protein n=1 Tax=Halalkalibacter sp. APA_J-10(15) TaxID=2933805 RepID=UPI001FF62F04|nr:ABC-ATPase domain-containing protein [Halalkalibacter sp. APA_J-10(15)]MCK0472010.1 ABC-ATPase domain-containing protein [Halalkalibacter sp. APA_J-10(15)]